MQDKTNWRSAYRIEDGVPVRDLFSENDCSSMQDAISYQIVFEVDNTRRYCHITAFNVDEALGIFIRNHADVTYNNIIDHFEN